MQDNQLTTMQPFIGFGMSPSPPPQSPLWSPNPSSEEESDNPDAELSDDPNSAPTVELNDTEEDYKSLKSDFSVLMSQAIVKFLPFFSADYKDLAQNHIPHRYSKEMPAKSEVVSILTVM